MLKEENLIKVWYHKGNKGTFGDRFISAVIKIFTLGRFSHTEIEFPEWVRDVDKKELNCFSSRGMDEPRGVHFKKINFSHANRWVNLPVLWIDTTQGIIEAYNEAKKHVGADYDFSVIPRFGLKLEVDNERKWWCSEICAKVLGFVYDNVSPIELYRLVKRMNKRYLRHSI